MNHERIRAQYLNWMIGTMCYQRYANQISYVKLLTHLHSVEFTYIIPRDENRAEDGISLRYRFAINNGYEDCADYITDILDGPCSVLEMMIALAIRCEESIMDDPRYGDRTTQWFWGMISSLGLSAMMDHNYDSRFVDNVVQTFLERRYQPNGRGGLFTIRNYDGDVRDIEIWYQLSWYLNSFV